MLARANNFHSLIQRIHLSGKCFYPNGVTLLSFTQMGILRKLARLKCSGRKSSSLNVMPTAGPYATEMCANTL